MGPRKGASTAVGSPLAESWQRNCAVTELLVRFSYHFTAAGGLGTSDVTIVLSQTDTFGYRMVLPYVLKALVFTFFTCEARKARGVFVEQCLFICFIV